MWTCPARLLLALPALALALLAGAPAASAHHSLDGTLQGIHADYFDEGSSLTDWQLDTGATTLDVLPTTLPALSPESNQVTLDDKDPGAGVAGPVTAAAPQAAPALGGRTTAVIAFNFATDPTNQPWTTAQIRSSIFTAANSTSAFFKEETYNQLWLTGKTGNLDGDVYGWYTIAPPTGCNPNVDPYTWASNAAAQASALNGFNAADYQHVMYVFPHYSGCGWAGLGELPGKYTWINGGDGGSLSVRVTGHELGHNLGLHHAGSWNCLGFGNQMVPISDNCTLSEYNDPFDVMGAWGSRHSSGWHLQQLGALQPSNVETVSASGTYSMTSALDSTSATTTLRVPSKYSAAGGVKAWYYLEIRTPGGAFENFLATDPVAKGVSIRLNDDPSRQTPSRLIDMRPSNGAADGALLPGEIFNDGQLSIRTISAVNGSATVDIQLGAGPLDQQAPLTPTGLSGAVSNGDVHLFWTGSADNVAVASYAVYRDGSQIGSTSGTILDDTTVLPGQHVYTVYAQDGAGNRSPASDPYVVTVRASKTSKLKSRSTDHTGPKLRLLRHRVRGGRLLITAKASDSAGVARVELRIDGRHVRARRAAKLSYHWRLRPGRHRIGAIAYDKRGNRTTYVLKLRVPRA